MTESQPLADKPMTIKRCLVVEDEDSGRDILTILLGFHQIEADAVESGEEALGLVKTHEYGAVLVDLLLPGMNGWELLKQIKDDPLAAHLKVIAIIAYYDPVLGHTARKAGFTGCYPKPVTPDFIPIFSKYGESHSRKRQQRLTRDNDLQDVNPQEHQQRADI